MLELSVFFFSLIQHLNEIEHPCDLNSKLFIQTPARPFKLHSEDTFVTSYSFRVVRFHY